VETVYRQRSSFLRSPAYVFASFSITAVVNKTSPDDKLGVSIKRLPSSGLTVVGKVSPDGLFGKTGLKEGMKVLKVNNRDVNLMELNDLLMVLKESSGMITILAEATPQSQASRSASVSSIASTSAPKGGPPKRYVNVE
jgi:C-terminal processing protease CtpA/Prc